MGFIVAQLTDSAGGVGAAGIEIAPTKGRHPAGAAVIVEDALIIYFEAPYGLIGAQGKLSGSTLLSALP